LSVLYGTFLTRSGVLADFSVHSFVDLGISGWLVTLMAFFVGSSLLLLGTRLGSVKTRPNTDPLISRGSAMVLGTLTLTASTLVITFGTSAPLLTGWFMERPGQVGPEFYNRVNMPLALLLCVLLAIVPYVGWRGLATGELLRRLVPSLVGAAIATIVGIGLGVETVAHAVFLFLAMAALIANGHETIRRARAGGLGAVGGYLSHVGVAMMFVGFLASGAYDKSVKVTLPQGEAVQVEDMTLTFQRFIPRQGREKERMEVEVVRGDGDRFVVYPKLFVNDRTQQLMANPDIRTTPLQDFYVSPISYQPAQPPRIDDRVQLAPGETARFGPIELRFVELAVDGQQSLTRFASGGAMEIGARLEVHQQGEQQWTPLEAVYRFAADGRASAPPVELPGSGVVSLTGVDPRSGQVQLDVAGVIAEPLPARLSIDVTEKPLIQLVWLGLFVVLVGGALSTTKRLRAVRRLDRRTARAEGTFEAAEPPAAEPAL
ncbi:MAG: cytochrome c-type biogenesis CcmF C-terminal domain-containing protein, partial [Acidobacteriota bacterium]